eukprot:gene17050-biopygen3782
MRARERARARAPWRARTPRRHHRLPLQDARDFDAMLAGVRKGVWGKGARALPPSAIRRSSASSRAWWQRGGETRHPPPQTAAERARGKSRGPFLMEKAAREGHGRGCWGWAWKGLFAMGQPYPRNEASCVRVHLRSCLPALCSQDPAFCGQDPALCVQLQSR